jgi:photosystem II stability/assembly factor-like uncharacterized protein
VFFTDKDHGWTCGFGGPLLTTSDRGRTWISQTVPVRQALYKICFEPSGVNGYAVGESGIILQTTDEGKTWLRMRSPTTTALAAVALTSQEVIGVGAKGTVVVFK